MVRFEYAGRFFELVSYDDPSRIFCDINYADRSINRRTIHPGQMPIKRKKEKSAESYSIIITLLS